MKNAKEKIYKYIKREIVVLIKNSQDIEGIEPLSYSIKNSLTTH